MNVTIRRERLRNNEWMAVSEQCFAYPYETSKRCIEDEDALHEVAGKIELQKRLDGHNEKYDTIVWTETDGETRTIITFHFNEERKTHEQN